MYKRQGLHADPLLGPLHRAAVVWRQARFETLMQQEPWRALFGRLLMTPPSQTLDLQRAQQVLRHAQRGETTKP